MESLNVFTERQDVSVTQYRDMVHLRIENQEYWFKISDVGSITNVKQSNAFSVVVQGMELNLIFPTRKEKRLALDGLIDLLPTS